MNKLSLNRLILLMVCHIMVTEIWGKFEITNFAPCPDKQGSAKFYATLNGKDNNQFIALNITFPFPVGDNSLVKATIQMSRDGKTFRQVHVIKEKNACRAANLYLGEQWTDIAKAIKIPLKTCPFPPGQYSTNNLRLDYNKLAFKALPTGLIRVYMDIVNITNENERFACIFEEMKHL